MEVAGALYSESASAAVELDALRAARFLQLSEDVGIRYRYSTERTDLDEAVQELDSAYKAYRVRVVDAIFSDAQ